MASTRPVWKGVISFGLVSVPSQLFSSEAENALLDFTMLDRRDNQRIRYVRVNDKTRKEVAWKDIVKGQQVAPDQFLIVTPTDLKKAAPKASRSIEITDFVSRSDIDPWYFERPYILSPLSEGAKGYSLLCAALGDSDRIGIGKVVLHTRQHLAAIVPNGATLMLNTMRFASELRNPAEVGVGKPPGVTARATKREIEMAQMLIDAMTSEWDPSKYHDEYRDALKKWLARRAKEGGAATVEPEDDESIPGPYNIMDLLKKSIEGQRKSAPRRAPSHGTKTG